MWIGVSRVLQGRGKVIDRIFNGTLVGDEKTHSCSSMAGTAGEWKEYMECFVGDTRGVSHNVIDILRFARVVLGQMRAHQARTCSNMCGYGSQSILAEGVERQGAKLQKTYDFREEHLIGNPPGHVRVVQRRMSTPCAGRCKTISRMTCR